MSQDVKNIHVSKKSKGQKYLALYLSTKTSMQDERKMYTILLNPDRFLYLFDN